MYVGASGSGIVDSLSDGLVGLPAEHWPWGSCWTRDRGAFGARAVWPPPGTLTILVGWFVCHGRTGCNGPIGRRLQLARGRCVKVGRA